MPMRIHIERFTPGEWLPEPEQVDASASRPRVTIELDGRTESTDHRPGTTILQTARQTGDVATVLLRIGQLRQLHGQIARRDGLDACQQRPHR